MLTTDPTLTALPGVEAGGAHPPADASRRAALCWFFQMRGAHKFRMSFQVRSEAPNVKTSRVRHVPSCIKNLTLTRKRTHANGVCISAPLGVRDRFSQRNGESRIRLTNVCCFGSRRRTCREKTENVQRENEHTGKRIYPYALVCTLAHSGKPSMRVWFFIFAFVRLPL